MLDLFSPVIIVLRDVGSCPLMYAACVTMSAIGALAFIGSLVNAR